MSQISENMVERNTDLREPKGTEQETTKHERAAPRSRFVPQAAQGMRLEERDEQLLCDLFRHRLMSRGQIERRYFSSTVRCNARLRLLFDHKFVVRHYPPAAPFGAQAIYSVGKAALPIVARRLEMDLPDVQRFYRRTQTPTFIEHTLAVVDFWLTLQDAVAPHDDLTLDLWLAEMQCRHEWEIRSSGGKWRKETFKPDAYFRLLRSSDERYFNFFLEMDLGHTSTKQFTGKLLTHRRYLQSGLFEQTYDCKSFHTLVVTTGERRLKNLRALAGEHGAELFWFVTSVAFHADPLGAIWQRPGHEAAATLLEE